MTPKANLQAKQEGIDDSPADGGEGYTGGNTNAGPVGFDYVTGKKGTVKSQPIWSQQTDGTEGSFAPEVTPAGSDSTDENASYKDVQTEEGLPQTWRTSSGAGDAGPADQVSVSTETSSDAQDVPSGSEGVSELAMPQTEFTHQEGSGAPKFKRSR